MTMQDDIGKKARIHGWKGDGIVVRVIGRTVEVQFKWGLVSCDRSKVVIF